MLAENSDEGDNVLCSTCLKKSNKIYKNLKFDLIHLSSHDKLKTL